MLGETIRNIRKQKGYSQETLALQLNVVRQTVSKWEKGTSVPDAEMLGRIADLLEIPVSQLLGDDKAGNSVHDDHDEVAKQLAILNEQLARQSRTKKRTVKVFGIVAVIMVCLLLLVLVLSQAAGSRSSSTVEVPTTSKSPWEKLYEAKMTDVSNTVESQLLVYQISQACPGWGFSQVLDAAVKRYKSLIQTSEYPYSYRFVFLNADTESSSESDTAILIISEKRQDETDYHMYFGAVVLMAEIGNLDQVSWQYRVESGETRTCIVNKADVEDWLAIENLNEFMESEDGIKDLLALLKAKQDIVQTSKELPIIT